MMCCSPNCGRGGGLLGLVLAILACPAALGQTETSADLARLTGPRSIAASIDSLSPTERDRLLRQKQHFQRLPREQQQRLRKLHAQLWAADDAESLYGVLQRYRDWLSTLSAGQRDDLLSRDMGERVAAIVRMKAEQDAHSFAAQTDGLSPEDAAAVSRWLLKYVLSHEQALIQHIPPELRRRVAEAKNKQQKARMVLMIAARHRLIRHLPPPQAEEFDELLKRLSPSARAQLESAQTGTERLAIVQAWIQTSWQTRYRYARVTEDDLQEFFQNELTAEEREQIERLHPSEMQDQLRRLYQERRGRWRSLGPPPLGPPPATSERDRRPFGRPGDGPPRRRPRRPE